MWTLIVSHWPHIIAVASTLIAAVAGAHAPRRHIAKPCYRSFVHGSQYAVERIMSSRHGLMLLM